MAPLLPLQDVSDPTRSRESRDRLEILTALLGGPTVEPYFRDKLVKFPADHPVYAWLCKVVGCTKSRYDATDLCHPHKTEWEGRQPGLTRHTFLNTAKPLEFYERLGETADCRICVERPADNHELRLCLRHHGRWKAAKRQESVPTFDEWLPTQTESYPGYGTCKVVACPDRASSPLALCAIHELRYRADGSPGGARRPPKWFNRFEMVGLPVPMEYDDQAAFRKWCASADPVTRAGTVNLLGLPPLVRAEFQWGLFAHTQRADHSIWPAGWLQAVVNLARRQRVASLFDLIPGLRELKASTRMILGEICIELRMVYFTPEETKESGYIESEHFGVHFPKRRSIFDLTGVSQRWLRDLLWDNMASRLRSPQGPRTPAPIDNDRRACTELSAFLEVAAPEGGHKPELLEAEHMRRFVADHKKRAHEGLESLILRRNNGTRAIVSIHTSRMTFNHARTVLRSGWDSGEAERIGLSRAFITALPYGANTTARKRTPFPDAVAQALADDGNLRQLADRYDPNNHGLRDAWEALVLTGRRCMEILNLRLECIAMHGGVPFLWHDQTKVGNLDEAIRIPNRLYERLKERQEISIERFKDRHGRAPSPAERKKLALFPARTRNPLGRNGFSYTFFHSGFSSWLSDLDLGGYVPHQARHTLATNLLKHGAGLHHIKQYLGQVSERMAEHYAKVASSEIEDVLHRLWVAGPGSAVPGKLLASPGEGMTKAAAQAMALDLSRRSTPAEGGFCTFQPVVRGNACPWKLNCEGCDKFVMSGADLLYWHRKREQWRSIAERAPDDATADYLHQVFEPTNQAIDGLEKALAALGLLDEALAMDLRRPQDYFDRIWNVAFRASDLAAEAQADDSETEELQ